MQIVAGLPRTPWREDRLLGPGRRPLLDPPTSSRRTWPTSTPTPVVPGCRCSCAAPCSTGSGRRSSGPGWLSDRRASDQLPPGRPAHLRCRRRQASRGLRLTAPHGLQGPTSSCPTRASARPSKCSSRRCAPRGRQCCATPPSSPRSWTWSRSSRRWGDHFGPDGPQDRDRGCRGWGLRPLGHPRSDRGRLLGLRRPGHRGRHLCARCPAATDDGLPQCLPTCRWLLRHRRREFASGTPAATSLPGHRTDASDP